jgi:predicted DCC family thiol-disulfide oxidoreductase YuxK
LVLYDGVCGLCNRLLRFLLRHDHRAAFRFAPLQSPTGQSMVAHVGGTPGDLKSFYVVADYQTAAPRVLVKSQAAVFVAGELGWPWRVAALFGVLPCALLDRVYDSIADRRYRVFGKLDRCPALPPEFRSRFDDVGA